MNELWLKLMWLKLCSRCYIHSSWILCIGFNLLCLLGGCKWSEEIILDWFHVNLPPFVLTPNTRVITQKAQVASHLNRKSKLPTIFKGFHMRVHTVTIPNCVTSNRVNYQLACLTSIDVIKPVIGRYMLMLGLFRLINTWFQKCWCTFWQ